MTKFLILILALSTQLHAKHTLSLDLQSQQYKNLLSEIDDLAEPDLERVIETGSRLLSWIKSINKKRTDNKIELYIPGSSRGIPITKPAKYNGEIAIKKYLKAIKILPESMVEILTTKSEIPNKHSLASDEEFIKFAKKIDGAYQTAARWKIMKKWLPELKKRRKRDIRGYYYLSLVKDLEDKLRSYKTMEENTKKKYTQALIGMCLNNNRKLSICTRSLKSVDTVKFYKQYLPGSKRLYKSFFKLTHNRDDITVSSSEDKVTFNIPFRRHSNMDANDWLESNVEQEWQGVNWNLNVDVVDNSDIYLIFKPGATPSVKNHNLITMDKNRGINNNVSDWTIRHEFGHVLGFPDCYIEFYDTSEAVMVNYQIDLDNIMCSRKGHIQDVHFSELKRMYN